MEHDNNKPIIFQEGSTVSLGQFDSALHQQLLSCGILKANQKGNNKVTFVGVATWRDHTYLFMPKVWPENCLKFKTDGIRLLVQVLRKYASKVTKEFDEASFLNPEIDGPAINRLALSDWLIKDYLDYGLYQRKENVYSKNGRGHINWSKTVNQIAPFMSNGQPVYFEYVTHSKIRDNENTLRQLHHFTLQESLNAWAPMLGYESISVEHERVTPFIQLPDTSSIRIALNRALMRTYSDRVSMLIKMLKAWYDQYDHRSDETLSLYGTSTFHTVWEKACGNIFCNEFDQWKQYYPKPLWQTGDMSHEVEGRALRPDIVRPLDKFLLLLDAKYYKLQCSAGGITGNPGVGDVSKQLFYERILSQVIQKEEKYARVLNYFIFPKANGELLMMDGHVCMDGLDAGPIHLIYMNVELVLQMYLKGHSISEETMREYFCESLSKKPHDSVIIAP